MSVRWSAEVRVAVALCSVWVCFAAFSVSPLSSPHQQQHRRHLNHHQYRGHVTHGLQCSVVERAITYSAAQGMTVPLSRPYESSTQDISPPLQEETPLLPPAPSDGPSAATSVLFTLLSALAILISYADRANISTTIVSMAQQYRWDSTFQGFVLTSFFAGYALTQTMGGALADRIGGERVLTAGLVLWSVCTLLTPAAAAAGALPLILVRVALGLGEGVALPAVHSMIPTYVNPRTQSLVAGVVTSACYIGALLAFQIVPSLIAAAGWESAFYSFGALPLLSWLPMWAVFLGYNKRNRPQLARSKDSTHNPQQALVTPRATAANIFRWLRVPQVWAIVLAQYGQGWGMYGLLSWLPTYFSAEYNVDVASLARFTTLPYILQSVVAVLAGSIADAAVQRGVRVLHVRQLMQAVGMLAPAACLCLCAWGGLNAAGASSILTVGTGLSALTVAAVSVNHLDIAPRNAGTVFAIGNTAATIGGLLAVPTAGWLYNQSHSWTAVFALFAAHYVVGWLGWVILASDKPLPLDSLPPKL